MQEAMSYMFKPSRIPRGQYFSNLVSDENYIMAGLYALWYYSVLCIFELIKKENENFKSNP